MEKRESGWQGSMKLIIDDKWINIDGVKERPNTVYAEFSQISSVDLQFIESLFFIKKEILFAISLPDHSAICGRGIIRWYAFRHTGQGNYNKGTIDIQRVLPIIDSEKEKMADEVSIAAGFVKEPNSIGKQFNPITAFLDMNMPVTKEHSNDRLNAAFKYINERLNHEKT